MSNVHILKDINKGGHRLGSAYEQELEKKLRSITEFNSEVNDLSEKLVNKYNDIGNKISQLNVSTTKVRSQLISERKSHAESQRELEAKYTAEIQSLKSKIKTLKREKTLAQKASSTKILSLEARVRELEEYEIECMEKGKESSDSIFRREIDALYSAWSKLREKNRFLKDQLVLKKEPRGTSHNEVDTLPPSMNDSSQPSTLNPLSQIISVGSTEVVSLPATAPIIASSLMSPLITYTILTLLLITII
ncbi:hypothetical protein C1645_840871 [Glomus cerebriforme]|uniref:Uncharacterized protein n=1 Tax=Glomus cerebriforme TaxID=658196 RepID=A0A397RYU7_9GLOM|nr:hypothetical protein C1645_840871 [Glomus cerebriforme]